MATNENESAKWFYRQGEEKHGPFTAEQLKQLLSKRKVQPTDMVWMEGMAENGWVEARKASDLFPNSGWGNPIVIGLLLMFPFTIPVGLYRVWRRQWQWSNGKKWAWTGACVAYVAVMVSSSSTQPDTKNQVVAQRPADVQAQSQPAGGQQKFADANDKRIDVTEAAFDKMEKDQREAVKSYRKAADQGNVEAQYNLGDCYFNGKGVVKDQREAVTWYRKAAEQGNATAQIGLGYCYFYGEGVEKDGVEAVKWYRKAAEQGNAAAQIGLGRCYIYGEGVEKDEVEAVKWYGKAVGWFRKAADQGDADAQFNLGRCYELGEGVAEDKREAVKWFRKAAEQGNATAQNRLGDCYTNGTGVEKDKAEAVKWYRKAAEQGLALAQHNLGDLYFDGDGVEKDRVEAVKWYRKAADRGDAEAKAALGKIRPPETKENAKKKVEAFERVTAKWKSFPDKYATTAEREKFNKELEALQDEFFAIPFDATQHKDEAKKMLKAFDDKVNRRYSGQLYNLFEEEMIHMGEKYMNAK